MKVVIINYEDSMTDYLHLAPRGAQVIVTGTKQWVIIKQSENDIQYFNVTNARSIAIVEMDEMLIKKYLGQQDFEWNGWV